jgi:Hypervirulence associated proteins TUDOR domain
MHIVAKPGDRVREYSTGKNRRHDQKNLTSSKKIKSHVAKASKENPEYLVQSEKSGKEAAHRPGELG